MAVVINILKNDSTCEDMSKVVVPKEIIKRVAEIANEERKERKK